MVGGAALAVYHQKRDVRPFYRPYGAKHPVSFDRLVYPGPSPYPRGVDQDVPLSVLLVEGVHRVAGGSGRGAGYEPLLPEHPVDEGGLSDVGLSYDGYPGRPFLPAAPGERLYVRGYLVHELVDVAVVKGGNGQDFPRSRAVELVRAERLGGISAVHLVHRVQRFLPRPAKIPDYVGIPGHDSLLCVEHHDYEVGFGQRRVYLLSDQGECLVPVFELQAARVHQRELLLLPAGVLVDPVPGDPGDVFHYRLVPPYDPVEKGGLSDVGPSDYGHYGFSFAHARVARRGSQKLRL